MPISSMPISSLQASRIICEIENWNVSNLAIQKILYIAQGAFMVEKGSHEYPLVSADFYAWGYGPVDKDIYNKFKIFGADKIARYMLTKKHKTDEPDYKIDEHAHIKKVMGWLSGTSPSQLVAMTHAKGGAWEINYKANKFKLICREDIYNEYKRY